MTKPRIAKFMAVICANMLLQTVGTRAGPARRGRNETTDLWDLDEPDQCPPFPNCAPGYTCRVYKHPGNCPVCECVACRKRACIARPGELCHWSKHLGGASGCGGCHCWPCPPPPTFCQPGCHFVITRSGCVICKCPYTEKEINARHHTNADAGERPVQKLEEPRANPYDP